MCKMETKTMQAIQVNCENPNCKHKWLYTKGTPKYRIRCPKCHSAKNNVNHELFGSWNPSETKEAKKAPARKIGARKK